MEFSYNTKRTKKYRHGSKEKSKIASRNIVFKMNSLPKTSFFRTAWCVILAVFKAMREVQRADIRLHNFHVATKVRKHKKFSC